METKTVKSIALEKYITLNNYKYEFILVFVFLTLSLILRFIFNMPDMDEIWNYQFARRILHGQIPYKDFYMLQTPFSAQINALFLYLFSDKLIVMRWIGIFIAAINGLIIYFILRILGSSGLASFSTVCVFVCLVFLYPQNNYSWHAILFLSIAFLLELIKLQNSDNKTKIYIIEICIGIFLGFATISKQNIGILGVLGSFIFLLYYMIYIKKQSKYFPLEGNYLLYLCENVVFKTLGWTCVVGIEVLFLWINGAFGAFVDQAVINTTSFANNCSLPYITLFYDNFYLFKIFAVLVPVIIFVLFIQGLFGKKPFSEKIILILVSIYSFVNFSMVIPLADPVHLILAMPLSVIGASLFFNRQAADNRKQNVVNTKFIIFVFLITICFFIAGNNLKQINNKPAQTVKHYENIPIPKELLQKIKDIDNFIIQIEQSGKQVYFLDYRAAFYLIPLDKFSYKSDTMFLGNFGTHGEEEIIQMLSSTNDIVVLIRGNNMEPNRQETKVFADYVRSNMYFINNIQGFDIFTK